MKIFAKIIKEQDMENNTEESDSDEYRGSDKGNKKKR